MISLHQQMWQILTSSRASHLPYFNFLSCIDYGSEGDVISLHEQSRIYYFKTFPCINLQILRNIESFQQVILNKASSKKKRNKGICDCCSLNQM